MGRTDGWAWRWAGLGAVGGSQLATKVGRHMAEGTEADRTAGDHPEVERIEVDRTIAAEPPAIFAVLADPAGHVDIDASGMLMWAEGEPATAVDDRFVVHMDRDSLRDYDLGEYEVIVVITAFDQDREIAWTIDGAMQPPLGHVYGYRLEPVEGGTRVTSYYDWSDINEVYRGAGIFPVITETNLRATLGILARKVAPGAGRPGAG